MVNLFTEAVSDPVIATGRTSYPVILPSYCKSPLFTQKETTHVPSVISKGEMQPNNVASSFNPVYNPSVYHEEEMPEHVEVEETLSLEDKEVEMIRKALKKHRNKRKYAAQELGISERTLYRKIKEYRLE